MKYVVSRKPNRLGYLDDFDRIFSNFWDLPVATYGKSRIPSVDIRENEDAYIIEAELPGYGEEDVQVSVDDHVLHIQSKREEKKEEEKKEYLVRERTFSSFSRSFSLPEHVDEEHISGEFKNGILTLTIPKSEEKKPKRIEVKLAS